jgi:aspartyl-tRNA synthetase
MTDAPGTVDELQLRDLHIRLRKKEKAVVAEDTPEYGM